MNNYHSQEAGACVAARLTRQGRLLCSLLSSPSMSLGGITPLRLVKHSESPNISGTPSQFTPSPQAASTFHLSPNSAAPP